LVRSSLQNANPLIAGLGPRGTPTAGLLVNFSRRDEIIGYASSRSIWHFVAGGGSISKTAPLFAKDSAFAADLSWCDR